MMLNKFSEWRSRVIHDSVMNDKGDTFVVHVIYSKINDRYTIFGSVNGASGVFVSSQRNEKRSFKSLDTVKKVLSSHGINHFVVAG